jgi:hypothetical protein
VSGAASGTVSGVGREEVREVQNGVVRELREVARGVESGAVSEAGMGTIMARWQRKMPSLETCGKRWRFYSSKWTS